METANSSSPADGLLSSRGTTDQAIVWNHAATENPIFHALRKQALANFIFLVFGPIGIWSCATTIFVYAYFPNDFKNKGYTFLACLAGADLSVACGLTGLGLVRLVQLFTLSNPEMTVLACNMILAPYFFGYTVGSVFDFFVALDQLVYMSAPNFYRSRLGKKYVVLVVSAATIPTILVETPLFFIGNIKTPVSICMSYDRNIENEVKLVSDYVNLTIMLCTFLLYALIAYRSRDFVLTAAAQVLEGAHLPNEINFYVTKFVLTQRRLVRVSVFTALSFLMTNCLSMVLKMILSAVLRNEDDTSLVWVSYTAILQLMHAVTTIFIGILGDNVFKKRLKLVLRSCYGMRLHVIRDASLDLSASFVHCTF